MITRWRPKLRGAWRNSLLQNASIPLFMPNLRLAAVMLNMSSCDRLLLTGEKDDVRTNKLINRMTTVPTVEVPSSEHEHLKEVKEEGDALISRGPAELLAEDPNASKYHLHLFVCGTPRCARAIRSILRICQEKLPGRFVLEIVDIYQHPERAKEEQIVAIPTLVKQLPAPYRNLIGDMSNPNVFCRDSESRRTRLSWPLPASRTPACAQLPNSVLQRYTLPWRIR